MKERSAFSGRIGFVLAAASSAVGLGNIWRFPYLAAKYGGGLFLIVYVVLVITFGFSLMVAEVALGRKTGLSVIGAYKKLNKRWAPVGLLAAIIPAIILPYYGVIGGWVTKYLAVYIGGAGASAAADDYFTGFISSTASPLLWLFLFLLVTFVVVLFGVKKGIETASKFLMPILIALVVGITIYCLTLPGIWQGVAYYVIPDFSHFSLGFAVELLLAAMGQMFFSMSLSMGIMVTYGSYLRKDNDIEGSVKNIEWFDTGIAVLAGLLIVPTAFLFFGGDASKIKAGPSLMFITMPKVFDSMGGAGDIIGLLFFLLVLFAALTSAISLMETVVSVVCDRFGFGRRKACVLVFLYLLVLAVPSSLGFGMWDFIQIAGLSILDIFDFLSNSILMPLVALLTCIFVGYVIKPAAIADEVKLSGQFKREKIFTVMIRYIAPVFVVGILISSILNAFGVITL